jgi:putative restriction endonuclease
VSTGSDIRAAVRAVRTWVRGDQRAPHKPLLLLYALGRVQRGEGRLVPFTTVEEPLRRLLAEFGPSRDSYHPEYPFWRLQRDDLWEVPGGSQLQQRQGNTNPLVTELRGVSGGFPPHVDAALRASPDLVRELGHEVLDAHFPPSLHESILSAVGLDLDPPLVVGVRRARDRAFRELVLRAYGYQCAVCGLDARLDGTAIGLEAAHVHWHANRGPDTVANGLCLCPLHHKALDLGLIGLGEERRVLVSSRLHGGEAVEAHLGRFHGRALVGPLKGEAFVAELHAAWHRREVFKAPARAA